MTGAYLEQEPDEGTLQSALLATARLWLGAVLLTVPDALDCVQGTLLDDARASRELTSAGEWLLQSAARLPPAMSTVRVLQLLSASVTLDAVH